MKDDLKKAGLILLASTIGLSILMIIIEVFNKYTIL